MHSDIFWNSIYENESNLPWTTNTWRDISLSYINKYILSLNRGCRILDYGCGNGNIAMAYYNKGYRMDVADISSSIAVKLEKKFLSISMDINVYTTNNPITINNIYNAIICWGVLHHIDTNYWEDFLEIFHSQLDNKGILIIGGWDKEDIEFLNTDIRISKSTHAATWYINNVDKYINLDKFHVNHKGSFMFTEPIYNMERKFSFYVLQKI